MTERDDEKVLSYSALSVDDRPRVRFAIMSVACSLITLSGTAGTMLLTFLFHASYFEVNLLVGCTVPICIAGLVFGILGIFQSRRRALAIVGLIISSLNLLFIPSFFIA